MSDQPQIRSNLYRFDNVTVDCENFRLQRDGRNIALTPRAFDVLLFLLQHAGRVVEKQELFESVWKDTFVSDNALTKIVKDIRHALEDDANSPRYIETVPKRGYRFIAVFKLAEEPDPATAQDKAASLRERETSDAPPSQPTSLNDADRPRTKRRRPSLIGAIVLVLLISAAGYFVIAKLFPKTTAPNAPIDSIAVLPFENGTQDPNTEYLSDGITESLINSLSRLSGLKVIPRSSVFRYKGKEQNAQKVAAELNVRAVLTGSVKQVGDRIVITVRLDDANQHIWGEQYQRPFTDILAMPSEIAQEVSAKLSLKLSGAEQQRLRKLDTKSPEAYQFNLMGNYEANKHTQTDLQKAIDYYNQAIERDPNYALAYFGLSLCYGVLGNNYLRPHEVYPKAREYAAKALAIDDTLSEAHSGMSAVNLYYDWNWAAAEKELNYAQTLNPNNAEAHLLRGDCFEIMGRFDEAQAERKRSLEIDPLVLRFSMVAGATLYFARKNDEAIEQLKKMINFEPRYVLAYYYLGQAYEQKKMYAQAIATFQKGIDQAERHPQLVASLGHAYALAGQRDKALQAVEELRQTAKRRFVSPYLIAVIYVGLGENEQAFVWLDKAVEERSFFLIWLKVEPLMDSLRSDPRYTSLLLRVGLNP